MFSQVENLLRVDLQYGAFAIALACLILVAWMVRAIVGVLKKNSEVIALNTQATTNLTVRLTEQTAETRELKETLFQRPCILREKKS